MSNACHSIIATYIGKNEHIFKVGQSYLLRVEFRGTGMYPINVVFDYAQHYTSVPYRTILGFLKEWNEILTVVDPKLVEKSSKVLYIDTSEENELPFDEGEDEALKEYRKPTQPPVVMGELSKALLRIPEKTVFPNGAWVCSKCRHVNMDPAAFRCEECGTGKISFNE